MKKRARVRMFGNMPVVDAKKELRVFVNSHDIKTAVRKDPANCAFSNACRRLYGTHSVAFFLTTALVELPDGNRSTRLERFVVPKAMRELIVKLDRTGKADPDGYVLMPPSWGDTMDRRQEVGREYTASGRRAAVDGARMDRDHKKKTRPSGVRSGKGIVQFITKEKQSLKRLLEA